MELLKCTVGQAIASKIFQGIPSGKNVVKFKENFCVKAVEKFTVECERIWEKTVENISGFNMLLIFHFYKTVEIFFYFPLNCVNKGNDF